jgi:hypothetical protein
MRHMEPLASPNRPSVGRHRVVLAMLVPRPALAPEQVQLHKIFDIPSKVQKARHMAALAMVMAVVVGLQQQCPEATRCCLRNR